MKKKIVYEELVSQLEEIVKLMESGDIDIDLMGEEMIKANKLIALCKEKLSKTEAEINKIIDDK